MRGDLFTIEEPIVMVEDVDFSPTEQMLWNEVVEEEADPWEFEGEAVLKDYHPAVTDPRFPTAARDQGWAALVLEVKYLATILGVETLMLQLNHYDHKAHKLLETEFTFVAKTPIEGKI